VLGKEVVTMTKGPKDYCRFDNLVDGNQRIKLVHHIATAGVMWGYPPDQVHEHAAIWRDSNGEIVFQVEWSSGQVVHMIFDEDTNESPEMNRYQENMRAFRERGCTHAVGGWRYRERDRVLN
jgi:hypothetical protein